MTTNNKTNTERKFPQCNALDQSGKRCRKRSAIKHHYHGLQEIYGYGEDSVTWVEINVCPDHALAIGYDFTNPKKKQRCQKK